MSDSVGDAAAQVAAPPRPARSLARLVVLWVVAVAAISVALSVAAPRSVPRLTVLPAPGSEPIAGDGRDERWSAWRGDGIFWQPEVGSDAVGCIADA